MDATAAWSRVADILEEVIPSSELSAIVSCEAFSNKLLAYQLDYANKCRDSFRRSLLASHRAYGGGAVAWRVLSEQTFSPEVLKGARDLFYKAQEGFPSKCLMCLIHFCVCVCFACVL